MLILGNSILEGVGTALLIPPVYILTTMLFTDFTSRARAFGVISGMGGIGAAAGPLIGGLITTAISWRAAFVFQAVVIAAIVLLSRPLDDPVPPDPTRPFDTVGAVLSAVGLRSVVMGILAADNNGLLLTVVLARRAPSSLPGSSSTSAPWSGPGKEPLLSTGLFRNRTSNLGLVTQNVQWLLLIGTSFVVSAYLQVVRGYNAIQTGVIFTAATVGILVSSLAAERLAKRRTQRTLILAGFVITIVGIGVLLALVSGSPSVWAFAPGLLLIGLGVGVMLTPSVNVVQSALPRGTARARSPGCRAASPTSARRSAPRSPAPSSSPAWHRTRAYALAMASWPSSGSSAWGPRCSSPPIPYHSRLDTGARASQLRRPPWAGSGSVWIRWTDGPSNVSRPGSDWSRLVLQPVRPVVRR